VSGRWTWVGCSLLAAFVACAAASSAMAALQPTLELGRPDRLAAMIGVLVIAASVSMVVRFRARGATSASSSSGSPSPPPCCP
jgi:FtsH-binding integral membrane protein